MPSPHRLGKRGNFLLWSSAEPFFFFFQRGNRSLLIVDSQLFLVPFNYKIVLFLSLDVHFWFQIRTKEFLDRPLQFMKLVVNRKFIQSFI